MPSLATQMGTHLAAALVGGCVVFAMGGAQSARGADAAAVAMPPAVELHAGLRGELARALREAARDRARVVQLEAKLATPQASQAPANAPAGSSADGALVEEGLSVLRGEFINQPRADADGSSHTTLIVATPPHRLPLPPDEPTRGEHAVIVRPEPIAR